MEIRRGRNAVVGTGRTMQGPGEGLFQTRMHGYELSSGLVAVGLCNMTGDSQLPYPYSYGGVEGPPATIGEMFRAGTYAWDVLMMREKGSAAEGEDEIDIAPTTPGISGAAQGRMRNTEHTSEAVVGSSRGGSSSIGDSGDSNAGEDEVGPEEEDDDVMEVVNPPSHEDVMEVVPASHAEVELTRIRVDDYDQTTVEVDIRHIVTPEQTLRGLSQAHVEKLVENFRLRGLLGSLGLLSITPAHGRTLEQAVNNEYKVKVECVLVDGLHRLMALRALARGEDRAKWGKLTQSVRVSLWSRADGTGLSRSEVLRLGALLNEGSEAMLKMRFADKVHSGVSLIKILEEEHGSSAQRLSSQVLASYLDASSLISGAGERQYARYAELALKLVNTDGMLEKFENMCENDDKIGLTHFSYSELFRLSPHEFSYAMDCIRLLVAKDSRTHSWGRFEEVRAFFFQRALAIYRAAQSVGVENGQTMEQFFEESFRVSDQGGPEISVSQFVLGQAVNLKVLPRPGVREVSVERAATSVRRRLRGFFNIEEPIPFGSGGVKQPVAGKTLLRPRAPALSRDDLEVLEVTAPTADVPVRRSQRTRTATTDNRTVVAKRRREESGSDSSSGSESDVISAVPKSRSRPSKRRKTGSELERKGESLSNAVIRALSQMDHVELLNEMNTRVFKSNKLRFVSPPGEEEEDAADAFEDEDVDMRDVGQAASSSFDDRNPEALPEQEGVLSQGEPYNGEEAPAWCHMATVCPSRWDKRNVIVHKQPWLRAIHMPEGHLSELLDEEDLRYIHHAVYWHAARARHQELGSTKAPVLGVVLPTERSEGMSEEVALWKAAVERDEYALEYFAEKRTEMRERGYCVLDGFALDSGIPSAEGVWEKQDGGDVSERMLAFFEEDFEKQPDLRSPGNRAHWNAIINSGNVAQDESQGAEAKTRFMTTRNGVVDRVEEDEGLRWLVRKRALLDVRIGQVAAALKLWSNGSGKGKKMFSPRTGGRVLATPKGCPRQTLHSDFQGLVSMETINTDNPGYFTMVSGENPFPLWVCEGSHRLAGAGARKLRSLS